MAELLLHLLFLFLDSIYFWWAVFTSLHPPKEWQLYCSSLHTGSFHGILGAECSFFAEPPSTNKFHGPLNLLVCSNSGIETIWRGHIAIALVEIALFWHLQRHFMRISSILGIEERRLTLMRVFFCYYCMFLKQLLSTGLHLLQEILTCQPYWYVSSFRLRFRLFLFSKVFEEVQSRVISMPMILHDFNAVVYITTLWTIAHVLIQW